MRALRREDQKAWREMQTRTQGGLLWGGTERLAVHRGSEDFAGSALYAPARMIETAGQLPLVRRIVQGVDGVQQQQGGGAALRVRRDRQG